MGSYPRQLQLACNPITTNGCQMQELSRLWPLPKPNAFESHTPITTCYEKVHNICESIACRDSFDQLRE